MYLSWSNKCLKLKLKRKSHTETFLMKLNTKPLKFIKNVGWLTGAGGRGGTPS